MPYRFADTGRKVTELELHHHVSRRGDWVPTSGWGDDDPESDVAIEVGGEKRVLKYTRHLSGKRTSEEQRIIDEVAAERGEKWAEEHAKLIIAQAELIGDL